MKYPKDLFEQLKSDLKIVFESERQDVKIIKEYGFNKSRITNMWMCFHIVCDNRLYKDSHPMFLRNKRILPYDSNFEIYPNGTNDDHLETAIKKAFKELGI